MAPASKTAPSAPAAGGPGAAGEPGLFLIDGNSLVYRAFFALPESIATSTGFPTNAIFGFASMLVKILTEYGSRPTVVAWDAGSSGRKELYEEYKAQRRERPDLLGQQWPHMEPLVEAFGYRNVKVEGYEADDVIASIAEHARERAVPVMIVSGDRDVFQLIDEEGLVKVMATSRGITETKVYDRQAVIDRYGIPPELIPDFYGLKGDTSDNIPGVPGIGDKTASELLSRFGGLEEVLASVDQISGAKRKQNLIDHAEDARISKQLATMVRDIDPGFDALEESSREPDRSRLRDVFREFELRDPLRRLEEALGDAEAAAPAPAAEHQLSGRFRSASLADLEKLPAESELAVAVRAPAAPEGALFAEAGPWGFGVCVNGAGEDVPEVLFGECPDPAALVSACGDRPVIAHDAKSLDRVPPRLVHDTMLGAYLLEPARRGYPFRELSEERGLAAASPGPELGGTSPAVDPGNGPGPGGNGANAAGADAAALAAGAAQDALLVAALADWQRAELAKRGLEPLMRDIELPLVPVLRAMELTGVKLNTDRLAGITHRVRDEVAELEREIWSLAGEEFVIGSPQQLAEVLFVKLGLSRKRRGKTGFSTDARVLQAIRTEHPIIPKIERWRELSTLAKTYLDVLPQLTDERGRIHTTFLQAVAQTGRLSSTNPNMQNVPIRTPLGREIRGCFEAQEGNLLLSADYSQIELRVLAHAADEPVLEEIFQRGEDVHSATAAQVFQVATDQIDPGMRSKAKMINYGIVYGLSDFGLADRLNIPREEARAFIEAYLERFPRVAQFMKDTIATAAEVGHVSTLWGRRRQIPELRARNWQVRSLGERLAVNTVIQGTAADIIKLAMVRCHAALAREQLSTDLILTIHDELLFEGPADEMPAARELVEREMCAVWEHDPPLGVDIGVGSTWLEAK